MVWVGGAATDRMGGAVAGAMGREGETIVCPCGAGCVLRRPHRPLHRTLYLPIALYISIYLSMYQTRGGWAGPPPPYQSSPTVVVAEPLHVGG